MFPAICFNWGRSENDMMKRAAHISNGHQSPVNPPINSTPGSLVLLAAVFVSVAAMCPAQTVAALLVPKPADTKPVDSKQAAPATAAPSPSNMPAVRLQGVHAVMFRDNGRAGVTLALDLAGDYTYTTANSGPHLQILDLPGVVTDEDSASHLLASPLVSSYRVVTVQAEGHPVLRMEVLLKTPAAVDYKRTERGLEMRLTSTSGAAVTTPTVSTPAPTTPVVSPVHASQTSVSGPKANRLEKVQLSGSGDSTSVEVTANGVVEFKAFELRSPHRLVVDMADVINQAGKQPLVVNGPSPLRAVRVGQFKENPPTTRVVLELADDARYDVQRGSRGLQIEVRSASAAMPATPKKDAAVYAAAAQPNSPPATSTMPASRAVLTNMQQSSAAPKEDPAAAQSPEPIVVPRAAHAPIEESIPPSTPATPGVPMAVAEPSPVSAPAPVAPAPMPSTSASMARSPLPMTPQQAPGGPGPVVSQRTIGTPKRYTGEVISINVKDADIRDFFLMIQEISGLNVILDQAVQGKLTMTLNDVPWDQALDIVLKNNQLDKTLDGNVLRIATIDQVRQEQKAVADQAAAVADTVDRETVTRNLSYAKATELMATVRKFLTKRGDVVAYDRNNQLIITDIPSGIAVIDHLLDQLDRRTQQVEIEARVVAASRQFTRDLGSQFGFAFGTGNSIIGGNPIGGSNSPITRTTTPIFSNGGGNSIPLFSNFPAAGANVGTTYAFTSPHFDLDFVITAAEQKGTGKLLSRPKIVTQNNKLGKIQQGVQIPIQTTVNNTVSVVFQNVTLSMSVTPQITADGNIFMDIDVTNATIDPGIPRINGTPALDTQEATTSVLVPDGGTVVFGGVVQNSNNLSIQQVPILGSIPILGNLFKSTSVSTTTTELIFFVTPKIL
jgi:type IV pilus assembly protein PilQ